MKRLRIGFAILAAIIAVGLTVAAQAGVFDNKKTLVGTESDCFDVRIISGLPIHIFYPDCKTLLQLDELVNCPGSMFDDYGIFTDLTFHPVVSNPPLECPGSFKICCIEVERDESPCLGVPQQNQSALGAGLQYYQVRNIRCTQN